jgi:uncharacterized protein (TIGR02246 family)
MSVVAFAVLVAVAAGSLYRSLAQDRAADKKDEKKETPGMAAVRQRAEEFTEAFNKGDAKKVAGFWTKEGEFTGSDGETLRGRDEIEKTYTEFFKKNPKAKLELHIDSLRLLGQHTALEEGTLRLRLPGDKTPGESRYSVLHVKEDDGWHMATVREWVPDPATSVTVKDLDWLVGDWQAKGEDIEVRASYSWDEDKVFLHNRFTLKKGDKVIASGTQVIGTDPNGGLRSWLFDRSGSFGESHWSREENRWVIEASATLPDGSETTAVNIMIPLGKDAFTWQTAERTVAGSAVPGTPPVKVTRVKDGK